MPFSVHGYTVRWVRNSLDKFNGAIGATIRSVMLGRGEMLVEGSDVEIWTRLLIRTDECWLEIFDALDEKGYDCHLQKPAGTFISCI